VHVLRDGPSKRTLPDIEQTLFGFVQTGATVFHSLRYREWPSSLDHPHITIPPPSKGPRISSNFLAAQAANAA
jgi:hypothetical protein